MKKIVTVLFALLSLSALGQSNLYKAQEILVLLHPKANIYECIEKINQNFPEWEFQQKAVLSQRLNIHHIQFQKQGDVYDAMSVWQEFPFTLIAQPNHIHIAPRDTAPDDPQFAAQWAHNTIQSEWAWEKTVGGVTTTGDTIVAAVIDGGAELTHPDLDYFVNRDEIPNNGIDDDLNGYVDDVSGWDAYDDDGTVPSDYHGTHVSGIIAAKGNNNEGVAGVNWRTKILPIAGSSGQESTVIKAYAYALEMRAQYNESNGEKGAYVVVTNSSFGVNLGNPTDYPLWCAFYDSLGTYGILSAGATANADFDIDVDLDIPTACESEYLLTVTNTTSSDFKSSGAAYGKNTIDLGAPGTGILSTGTNGGYSNSTGTSMATPMVAGAVALMYSYACDAMYQAFADNPAGMALAIRDILLEEGVDTLASLKNLTATGGRLNTFKALHAMDRYCQALSNELPAVSKSPLIVYPNPSYGLVTVSTSAGSVIQVTNLLGEVLYLYAVNANRIDLQLPKGLYIISAISDGSVATQKVIVK